jgi:AraC-like DNA-binding protein/mannose-6-phosphate isomerase-like protein (cupin superfamily)
MANGPSAIMSAEVFQIAGDCLAPNTIVIGITDCLPNWELPFHSHELNEMHIVVQGSFLYGLRTGTYRLEHGDLCITKPGEAHSMKMTDGHGGQVIHIQLDGIKPEPTAVSFQRTKTCILRNCSHLIPILQEALTEFEQPGPLNEMMVSSLVCQFIVHLSRRIHLDEKFEETPRCPRDPVISAALWYMECNCRHGITVEEVAHSIGVSESLLSHRFPKVMHESVSRYNQLLVMKIARRLLEDDAMTVNEISERLQFPSHNYFSWVFKKHYGISPSRWRLLNRLNADIIE